MFVAPNTAVPQAKLDAAKLINDSNNLLAVLQASRREAFQFFWFPNGQLRSKDEVNAILAAMDEAAPGQSSRFFNAARELVELILSLAPDSLGKDDWYPPYQYVVDQNGSLRVV